MKQAVAQGTRRRMGDAANELPGHCGNGPELAREVGNVTGGRRALDRTSFYEWMRWFQGRGSAGLRGVPRIDKSHSQRTPRETVEGIKRSGVGAFGLWVRPGWRRGGRSRAKGYRPSRSRTLFKDNGLTQRRYSRISTPGRVATIPSHRTHLSMLRK